jgi:hypothetical protein
MPFNADDPRPPLDWARPHRGGGRAWYWALLFSLLGIAGVVGLVCLLMRLFAPAQWGDVVVAETVTVRYDPAIGRDTAEGVARALRQEMPGPAEARLRRVGGRYVVDVFAEEWLIELGDVPAGAGPLVSIRARLRLALGDSPFTLRLCHPEARRGPDGEPEAWLEID